MLDPMASFWFQNRLKHTTLTLKIDLILFFLTFSFESTSKINMARYKKTIYYLKNKMNLLNILQFNLFFDNYQFKNYFERH